MIVDVPVVFQRQVPDRQWIAGEQQMCCGFSLKQLPESQRRCLAQDVSAKAHALRPSSLEPFVNISTAHMLESTEVSAVPVEVVEVKTSVEEPPFPVQATAPFSQCKSSSYLLWPPGRPGRLQPGVNCLWPFRRSIIRFSLRCRHSLRLQRAATERDGVRCFAQQV